MKNLILLVGLLVIWEPYREIRYGEVDVYNYNIDTDYMIEVTEPEEEEWPEISTIRIWCYACSPPKWYDL